MLTVRRERPLGLGVCVSECVGQVVPPRRQRGSGSPPGDSRGPPPPPPPASLPLSVVLWVPARLPLGLRARPPFSPERGSASPCRWEPGLRLLPHAAIPTRPPSQAQRSGDSRPPARPPPPPPPALASLRSPVSAHPPLRRLRDQDSAAVYSLRPQQFNSIDTYRASPTHQEQLWAPEGGRAGKRKGEAEKRGTLKPGAPSLPVRGQATGPKAQSQPDCPQGAETTGRGNPSSRPSPKSLVAASAQSKRASADSRASQEAHTRPISQPEFPSGEPSGAVSRPGSGREGCGAAESSAGPGSIWFRVPGPAAKRSGRARPLPGGLPAPSCASRARHGSGEEGLGGARPIPQGPGPGAQVPTGVVAGYREHPAAPIPAQGEGDVARCPEVPTALLRELRGGDSQGRVLLAAAPGTSRPPRRRSHGDRKPSRRPERPALAPRAVPDRSWPPVLLDPSWLQAIVRTPEWTHFRHGGASPRSGETSPSYSHQHASSLPVSGPRSWDRRGAEPPPRPGRNTCSRALQLGAWREPAAELSAGDSAGDTETWRSAPPPPALPALPPPASHFLPPARLLQF
eukprot:XP_017457661.1 PREDICTED: WAS/WASL-interacting protein family member 2-like [Rattus norvegicus]